MTDRRNGCTDNPTSTARAQHCGTRCKRNGVPGWVVVRQPTGLILIIDDVPANVSILVDLLESEGHRVSVGSDAADGLSDPAHPGHLHDLPRRSARALEPQITENLLLQPTDDASQVEFLRERGCRVAQGYLYSRPVESERLTELLKRQPTAATAVEEGESRDPSRSEGVMDVK